MKLCLSACVEEQAKSLKRLNPKLCTHRGIEVDQFLLCVLLPSDNLDDISSHSSMARVLNC